MFNTLNSHAGHGKQDSKSCGTVGLVKESVENRFLNNEFIRLMKLYGKTIYDCTIDYPNSKSDCLNKIVSKCNSHKVDLDVSHHINDGRNDNVGDGKIGGVEVWVYSKNSAAYEPAKRICENLSKLGFTNRGVKFSTEYAVLAKTKSPAMIIEYFFDDDKDDHNLYKKLGYKVIAKAVVEAILNKTINDTKPPATENTKHYKNCVLYGNDIDKVAAEVIGWAKEDCIVKHVDNHVKWEATNLFTVGGPATEAMQKLNNGEKFGIIKGDNRYDTVRKCLEFVGK